jgi:hypothetical protein
MQTRYFRHVAACAIVALAAALSLVPGQAIAARVAILSNNYASATATDFSANVAGHTFTAIDVTTSAPSLKTLTDNFDVLLVFEDTTYVNATAVGNVTAAYANTGRAVVLGTFYDQDRSDGLASFGPHGWGALETIDPSTTDGTGTSYAPRVLDAASIVAHPLTVGVTTLFASKFAGGNDLKPASIVVANWAQKNARGNNDPAIAYRISGSACVIHIAIAPNYPSIGTVDTDFGGDFYRAWRNAFDFGAGHCVTGTGNISAASAIAIPALSGPALALVALLLGALGVAARRFARR